MSETLHTLERIVEQQAKRIAELEAENERLRSKLADKHVIKAEIERLRAAITTALIEGRVDSLSCVLLPEREGDS